MIISFEIFFLRSFVVMSLVSYLLINTSCSLLEKSKEHNQRRAYDESLLQKFETGSEYLKNKRYRQAADIFDKISREKPVSQLDLLVIYNAGTAYEGLGWCKKAGHRYRRVVRSSMGKFPKIKTQALFRLSYIYECLGHYPKVIRSLQDVYRRKKYLSQEMAWAELPARLATAYAHIGHRKKADKYFFEAENGLIKVRAQAQSVKQQRDLMAKTLFFMGRMNQKKILNKKHREFISGVRYQQAYLLKSIELNSPSWSVRAADQLMSTYDFIWQFIQRPPKKTDHLDREKVFLEFKIDKREKIQMVLENLTILRQQKVPDLEETTLIKHVFTHFNKYERRLKNHLASLAVDNELTETAKKREGLKREGRTSQSNRFIKKKRKKRSKNGQKKDSHL